METLPVANEAEGGTATGSTGPNTNGEQAATLAVTTADNTTSVDITTVTDDEEEESTPEAHHYNQNHNDESLRGIVDHSMRSNSSSINNNDSSLRAHNHNTNSNMMMMSMNSHSEAISCSYSDYDDADFDDSNQEHQAVLAHHSCGSSELIVEAEDPWSNEYSSRLATAGTATTGTTTGTTTGNTSVPEKKKKKRHNRRRSLTAVVRSTKKGFQKLRKRASMEHTISRSNRNNNTVVEAQQTQVPPDVAPKSQRQNKLFVWKRTSSSQLKKRSSLPPNLSSASATASAAATSAPPNMRASVQGPVMSSGGNNANARNNAHPNKGTSPFNFRRDRALSSDDAPPLPGLNEGTNPTAHTAQTVSFKEPRRMSNGFVKAPVRAGRMMVQNSVRAGLTVTHAVVDGGKAVGNTVAYSGKAFVDGTTAVVQQSGKAVVGGSKALVEGTTSVVQQGGKAVVGGSKALVEGTTSVVQQSGKAMVGGATAFVEGTTSVVQQGGKAMVGGATAFVEGTTSVVHQGGMAMVGGGKAIVEGTTSVVVGGGKTVLSGGMAVVGGTTMVVGMGGKTMAKGALGVVKGLKRIGQNNPLYLMYPPAKRQKSTWEEGIDVIDELLDPTSDTFEAMTTEQRRKLANVKTYLLNLGPSAGVGGTGNTKNKTQHIPQELMQLQTLADTIEQDAIAGGQDLHNSFSNKDGLSSASMHSIADLRASSIGLAERRASSMAHAARRNSNFILQEYAGLRAGSIGHAERRASSMAHAARRNSNFILQEYAGMDMAMILDDHNSDNEDDVSCYDDDDSVVPDQRPHLSGASADSANADPKNNKTVPAVLAAHPLNKESGVSSGSSINNLSEKWFVPPELTYMERSEQIELCQMLSWDTLSRWNYDIFRLNEITHGHPLLFVGWAILGSPYAHQAVAKEFGIDIEQEPQCYSFMDDLSIPPEKLCNYLRIIEQDYNDANPYHNSIHAADVVQTLHSLIQQSRGEDFMTSDNTPKINIFAILLSAIIHDVNHPGTTNAFHAKLKTELALVYNDTSILESWHISHGFARMLDLDVRKPNIIFDSQVIFARKQTGRNYTDSANNLLCNASEEQFETIRKLMIEAVLHTDMTKHFEMVDAVRGMLKENLGEIKSNDAKQERSWRLLIYMLHLADISGQAKGDPLFKLWTDRCLDEFFLQGDEEATLGLPISPNCDRQTTVAAESQLGFIRFVIEPSYEVLAQFIPFVEASVLPILQHNLEYWFSQTEAAALAEEEDLIEEEPTIIAVEAAPEMVDPK